MYFLGALIISQGFYSKTAITTNIWELNNSDPPKLLIKKKLQKMWLNPVYYATEDNTQKSIKAPTSTSSKTKSKKKENLNASLVFNVY